MKKRHKKRKWISIVPVLVMVLMLMGCGSDYVITTGFRDNELFRIDKLSCFKEEYLVYLTNVENQYSNAFGDEIWQQSVNDRMVEEDVMQTVLARLVKIKIMNLLAEQNELSLSEEELKQAENAAEAYYNSLSEGELEAFEDIRKEQVKTMYEEYALAQIVYHYYTDGIQMEISDDDVRVVELKQICIPFQNEEERQDARGKIDLALARLQGGENFDVLAAEYNRADEDTLSVSKGMTESAIENAAFNISEGTYSQVVEGSSAYYVFYCVSAYDETQVMAEKEKRIAQSKQNSFDKVYELFAAERECFLNQEVWDSVTSVKGENITTSDFFEIYNIHFQQNELSY